MWVFFSSILLVSESTKNILLKKASNEFSPFVVSWAWRFFSLVIFIPAILITGIPQINKDFWIGIPFVMIIFIIAPYLYSVAIKISPLSLTIPMLSFTPVFLVVVSYFLNNEKPTILALIGILFILFGAYVLNLGVDRKDLLVPFRSIYKEKGTWIMLIVAIMWSFGSALDKFSVDKSSAVFYVSFITIVYVGLITPILFLTQRKQMKNVFTKHGLKTLFPLGLLDGLGNLTQMLAVGMTVTAYVIAIKRTSIVLTSILSWKIFHEEIKSRIGPIILMVFGVILILLS